MILDNLPQSQSQWVEEVAFSPLSVITEPVIFPLGNRNSLDLTLEALHKVSFKYSLILFHLANSCFKYLKKNMATCTKFETNL